MTGLTTAATTTAQVVSLDDGLVSPTQASLAATTCSGTANIHVPAGNVAREGPADILGIPGRACRIVVNLRKAWVLGY